MDIFRFRDQLISNYSQYVQSFFEIRDERIREKVRDQFRRGLLWPEVLIQLNPSFKPGASIDELVAEEVLHPGCAEIFRRDKTSENPQGLDLRLHTHQVEAVAAAAEGENYVLTTGTGSGKSLSYIVPIVNHVLREGSGNGIKAIIVYPMNALANSQEGELEKFVQAQADGCRPVTFRRYTGQEREEARKEILENPPDILLTNYVMLELILTRPNERPLVQAASNLRFLVLDELHTYRGRQGADVALLVRRLKNAIGNQSLLCVGTSATMGGGNSAAEQQKIVSEVASLIFGETVKETNVIGETLEPASDISPPTSEELRSALSPLSIPDFSDASTFVKSPLCRWVEGSFGLRKDPESDKLIRARARPILGEKGAAQELSTFTGVDAPTCAEAITATLMAGFSCQHPVTARPLFAFRLHQFISRGGSVYASPELPMDRYITLQGQQYVPGDRDRVLLPLVFCRECGQDYYCVARIPNDDGATRFESRDIGEKTFDDDNVEAGFLLIEPSLQWPTDSMQAQVEYLPEDWIEEVKGVKRIRKGRVNYLPTVYEIDGLAESCEEGNGRQVTFFQAPFRFCPCCGVSYDFRQRSDIAKLTTLGTEGRSTATTILSLFTLLGLEEENVVEKAKKLLSFTDNRQDAALQAGHYNDFIEVGLLRAALYKALEGAGKSGLEGAKLPLAVFEALNLPFDEFASDPGVKGAAKKRTESAFRDVITYRFYRDLKRGWRVIMPNLEQVGLLKIEYPDLTDLSKDDSEWAGGHEALVGATPETRAEVCQTLLDFMRRGLAIKVNVLDEQNQEAIKARSFSLLKDPWALGEDEVMEHSAVLFARSRKPREGSENIFLSSMSGFGLYLRRSTTFPGTGELKKHDTEQIIRELLEALCTYGLIERVEGEEEDDCGYQLQPDAMIWKAGDGSLPFHDRIRMPGLPEDGGRTNEFFIRFYRELAEKALGTEALEHTAQVSSEDRESREIRFRRGSLPAEENELKGLPILYCSPTMELGIDISELNVVNMRNVPPTPANYAQRSGRAGRSGSPAMVFTYCAGGNAHDQFFFSRPDQMVSGNVSAPRIEVANEDLLKAHVCALWLTASGLSLQSNMTQLLDVDGDQPTLDLRPSVKDALEHEQARAEAKKRSKQVLGTIESELEGTDWWDSLWVDRTIDSVNQSFELACERWRGLYRAALRQFDESTRIIRDASRSAPDKKRAQSLLNEAKNQMALLTQETTGSLMQSDFYTYRYFAGEGFLPGYSFPRLPLSAYIPGRRKRKGHNEYLSRARFLAISEFGPQAMVYHAGNKYQITRSLIPLTEDGVIKQRIKLCPACGYLHYGGVVETLSNCDHCNTMLQASMDNLFRMENVSTTKRQRISSDEEERFRQGFELLSGVRFAERDGQSSFTTATISADDGEQLFKLYYGGAATIWRVNLGWRRRKRDDANGFLLDIESGRWKSNAQAEVDIAAVEEDATIIQAERVVPYVEDRRNALLVQPLLAVDDEIMASLQAALKQGIQIEFQLEDMELASEPLPSEAERSRLLFFESAEGGAGVLRQLLIDGEAMRRVAARALDVCHFTPDGTDLMRAPGADEDCEAACYQCLLSYTNQRDHPLIDRKKVRDILLQLTSSSSTTSGGPKSRTEHLDGLKAQCSEPLEHEWLDELEERKLRLPSDAQLLLEEFGTRPDFFYKEQSVAIYVDGRHHDLPDRAKRDQDQEDLLESKGIRVIRFRYDVDWSTIFAQYQYLFGKTS